MSGVALTDRARDMLSRMPPYEADDEFIQDYVNALAKEFERLDEYLAGLALSLRPQNATDEFGVLSLLEQLSGLPVAPEVSLAARRARVLAAQRRGRGRGVGAGWAALISLLLGSEGWREQEDVPGPYEVTITVPFPSTSYQAGGLQELLARITGAGIRVHLIYSDAFLVGIGKVGDSI